MEHNNLLNQAKAFEKLAQQVQSKQLKQQQLFTADADAINRVLRRARLIGNSTLVSPILDRVDAPAGSQFDIQLDVEPGYKVSFRVNMTPNHPEVAAKLAAILQIRFGRLIAEAVQSANYEVKEPIQLPWLNIRRV